MPLSEWEETTIGDVLLSANTGLDAIKRAPIVDYDSGIKCLRIQDVSQTKLFKNWGFCNVTPENYKKFALKVGDIIIARTGATIGVNLLIKENLKAVFNNGLIRLRVNDKLINYTYLYYNFRTKMYLGYIDSISSGTSTQPNMQINALLEYPINLPPFLEQQAIAEILDSIDDKIELNSQMNKTLEDMAQAIFKSWFVDFDPVKAKAEGRTIEDSSQEILDLFPDSFEGSELGDIPKGWNIEKLGDVTTYLKRGISPKYIEDDGILVINQRCIRNNCVDFSNARRHDLSKKKIEDKWLEFGDVLINSTGVGTLGRVAQVDFMQENKITADSHVTIVKSNTEILTKNYLGLNLIQRQLEIENLGEGSTGQTELSRQRLSELKLIIPNLHIQEQFDEIINPIRNKITINNRENITLSNIRDSLLPKLISGEIRVGDAEKIMEGVL